VGVQSRQGIVPLTIVLLALLGTLVFIRIQPTNFASINTPDTGSALDATSSSSMLESAQSDTDEEPMFELPRGTLPSISCQEAQQIRAQVRTQLPYAPHAVRSEAYAERAALWIDALGLLTGDGKSAFALRVREQSGGILGDLEQSNGACPHARALATTTKAFVDALRDQKAEPVSSIEDSAGLGPLPNTGSSEARVRVLREREQSLPPILQPFAATTLQRALPTLSVAEWENVVLAGAIRAWLPLLDSHSEWAPEGEEASIYDVDLDDVSSAKLYAQATETLVGARIDREPAPPLEVGDVVLSVNGVTLGGLSPEQLVQTSVAAFARTGESKVRAWRRDQIVDLSVKAQTAPLPPAPISTTWLSTSAAQEIGVLAIQDVHDHLGKDVGAFVATANQKRSRVLGLVLDLRGNGGGSMDGALEALGHFLPGLPMFPLRAKNESIPADVTPVPPADEQWEGPVLALVDGDTASAAEMLAGALSAYSRGIVVGNRTYGKGCVQEYLDDSAHKGLLRLTTLIYALPDGHAVQQVGITPNVPFSFGSFQETEASAKSVPPSWTGPDVRPHERKTYAVWPRVEGELSPCKQPLLCEALVAALRPKRAMRR
jgi:carboxyl-terminal processing protease